MNLWFGFTAPTSSTAHCTYTPKQVAHRAIVYMQYIVTVTAHCVTAYFCILFSVQYTFVILYIVCSILPNK